MSKKRPLQDKPATPTPHPWAEARDEVAFWIVGAVAEALAKQARALNLGVGTVSIDTKPWLGDSKHDGRVSIRWSIGFSDELDLTLTVRVDALKLLQTCLPPRPEDDRHDTYPTTCGRLIVECLSTEARIACSAINTHSMTYLATIVARLQHLNDIAMQMQRLGDNAIDQYARGAGERWLGRATALSTNGVTPT